MLSFKIYLFNISFYLSITIYHVLLILYKTCYAFIMESSQAFVSDPTLGAIGIELFADEQDVAVVQQDPPFVQEWMAGDVE